MKALDDAGSTDVYTPMDPHEWPPEIAEAAMEELARIRQECEARGLPCSVEVLMRHIKNNHAAALGGYEYAIKLSREKLNSAVTILIALCDDILQFAKLAPGEPMPDRFGLNHLKMRAQAIKAEWDEGQDDGD